jgi:polyisoprenyl-teichoic acid--peptidoglycan teichoic acid transferase
MTNSLRTKKILLGLGIVVLISGCLFTSVIAIFSKLSSQEIKSIPIISSINGQEPTPFQPLKPTATPQLPIYSLSNALVPSGTIETIPGQVNILILGSDWRVNRGMNTDVITLVSIYTYEQRISLLSLPRDLWVDIPGFGKERINAIYAIGGFPLLQSSFERNFSIHLDHYMMTSLDAFVGIVDTLGGVDINASTNLTDKCDLYGQKNLSCSIGPGLAHMDGQTALWYVRSRHTTSDIDRTRRAQEVLVGLFNKVMSLGGLNRIPELYDQLAASVKTDLSISNILSLIPVALSVASDNNRIRHFNIGLDHGTMTMLNFNGINYSVILPNYGAIWEIVKQAVYTP